ncbi:hypothetical protein T4B_12807 [Trichinella pseudospiralis]|uniref:Uncharacterized protein n=1 Tax=Trichinella pseudospiralis TaxID=6337 RepID=A0A0V1JJT7_TRIPS|nr:hypothetical protein T4B_12807 [Trichinella pseudospiralis]KRZ35220.1 hypothetical protein T4C_12871 [Trichinella pseudospiralis]
MRIISDQKNKNAESLHVDYTNNVNLCAMNESSCRKYPVSILHNNLFQQMSNVIKSLQNYTVMQNCEQDQRSISKLDR